MLLLLMLLLCLFLVSLRPCSAAAGTGYIRNLIDSKPGDDDDWELCRFVGGGHTIFCGFLNMGVHIVMYFYYFMSAMGPSVQKYLWWKR